MCTRMHTCVEARDVKSGVILHLLSPYALKQALFLTELTLRQFPLAPPASASPGWNYRRAITLTWVSGDPNSGPHTHAVSALTAELCLSPAHTSWALEITGIFGLFKEV